MKIKSERTYYISPEEIQKMIAVYVSGRDNVVVKPSDVKFEITPRDSRPHDDFHNTVMEHLKQAVVTITATDNLVDQNK